MLFGPVAQLGERTVRIRKVESSILFRSTNEKTTSVKTGVVFLLTTEIPQDGFQKIFGRWAVTLARRPIHWI